MLACPSCGAPVPLRSAALPYATCEYCRTLILREGQEGRAFGSVAALPEDISPIQLRTRGIVDGVAFTVVGRVRWGWAAGSWNEWLLLRDDGSHNWLGEAMGQYLLTAEAPELLAQSAAQRFAVGGEIAIGETLSRTGVTLTVTDIKQAHCLGGEGDLPFPALAGRTLISVDLRGAGAEGISLQRDEDGATAWAGRWCELADLAPRNLRVIEGWAMPGGMA